MWASTIQTWRYSKDFACLQMSEELEQFFEKCGLDCDIVYGFYKDRNPQIVGMKYDDGRLVLAYRNSTKLVGHAWLSINVSGFHIPFEATTLLPVDPQWYTHFDAVVETKGLYTNGKFNGGEWVDIKLDISDCDGYSNDTMG